jgi:transcriptional antiterminator RfaH
MDLSFSPDAKWYCLRAQPKHEHIASAHLRLCDGIEVYCPRVKIQRSTRRGLVWFTEALFPNYLFARFEMARWHAHVRYCQGVSGIVRFGTDYPEVPERALCDLRAFMDNAELKTVSYTLVEGDAVEIVEGPFRGQTGVVQRLLPARERVKVLLEVLGGTNQVDLQLTAVFKQAPLQI